MINFSVVQVRARALFSEIPWLSYIDTSEQYKEALDLIDELFKDYDNNKGLIDILTTTIERYEDTAPEFAEFNQAIENIPTGVAVLRVLMDQYGLTQADLKNEIGEASLVSQILNGTKSLTVTHIKALSTRFKVSSTVFID
ncbi:MULTISPECIES: helix-turn-helix domain-containing protein [Photorhabdus]|uniref:Putative transcription regulator n=1 Tax=Photorhabdus aegyptia TaxID=2805098 RepID=A0A022PJ68_9GAMM|nr:MULTISPECIES: helix-turn-helix domain-containing protein [Photorhabdus]EYU16182.1 putative transcription regulator [Photorhabdus aegyptia]MBS9424927.1 helix-turn-helix domain-containing protein [Photorhabdus caribbeanensis]